MKIILSPFAEFKLQKIVDYLIEEWSTEIKDRFLNQLNQKFIQLQQHPYSCKRSDACDGIYWCVVTPQTSFFYRIYDDSIQIITVVDTRQDPQKINDEIMTFIQKH